MTMRLAFLSLFLVSLSACAAVQRDSDMRPFILPTHDTSESVTSLAAWNHRPAGLHGFVSISEDGHFVLDGRRVRFFGMDVGPQTVFADVPDAKRALIDAYVGRMVKFGINAVRGQSLRIDGQVVGDGALAELEGLAFIELCKETKVSPWSKPLHMLHKSCIDDWVRIAPANVVMEWATHSALSTTMRYYSRVSREDERLGQRSLLARPKVG